MKTILATLLVVLLNTAHAQYIPDCYPLTKGTLYGWPVLRFNANGFFMYYACDLVHKRTRWGYAIEYGALVGRIGTAGPELAAALSKSDAAERSAALDAYAKKWTNFPCTSPTPGYEAICGNLRDAMKDDPLPQPIFTVAKNGTNTTRPTYVFADGKRGALAAERTPIAGVQCNAEAAYVKEGASQYAGVLGRSDRVALCVRQ